MNLVCLDTHYFTWALLETATLGQEDKIPKSKRFFQHLDETESTIVVPTPVITELLMEAELEERARILSVVTERFHVVEFDVLAAKNAADVWNTKKRSGVIQRLREEGTSMRTKIKVDVQFLGIAMASNCSILYTEDKNLRTLADGLIITRQMPEIADQMTLI